MDFEVQSKPQEALGGSSDRDSIELLRRFGGWRNGDCDAGDGDGERGERPCSTLRWSVRYFLGVFWVHGVREGTPKGRRMVCRCTARSHIP